MFDQLVQAIDGFVEAVRQKAHDAVDRGCDAVEHMADVLRPGSVTFAAGDTAAKVAACRQKLEGCEAECSAAGVAPGTVGAGLDLGKLLKIAAWLKQGLDLFFSAPAA